MEILEIKTPRRLYISLSVVASITDRYITSGLVIHTLQKALNSQPAITDCIARKSEAVSNKERTFTKSNRSIIS